MNTQNNEPIVKAEQCNGGGRQILDLLGDKWSLLSIYLLSKGRSRFSELLKNGHGISQRMLTTTLRNNERNGFIKRYVYPEVPPRVEYELTPLGEDLLAAVRKMMGWVEDNWNEIEGARQSYDSRQEKRSAVNTNDC